MANTLKKLYKDLDLTFARNPVTGDVAMSYDEQAVIRSIRNIIQTNFYERPFQPNLGSNVPAFLFENFSVLTGDALEADIKNAIINFEPRANITQIRVIPDEANHAYNLTITFFIGNNSYPSTINVLLQRVR
jgi:phage baseplate assembly protein W